MSDIILVREPCLNPTCLNKSGGLDLLGIELTAQKQVLHLECSVCGDKGEFTIPNNVTLIKEFAA